MHSVRSPLSPCANADDFMAVSACCPQMSSQYQRSVPLEVRRAEGERVRAKHPDKIPVSTAAGLFSIDIL